MNDNFALICLGRGRQRKWVVITIMRRLSKYKTFIKWDGFVVKILIELKINL